MLREDRPHPPSSPACCGGVRHRDFHIFDLGGRPSLDDELSRFARVPRLAPSLVKGVPGALICCGAMNSEPIAPITMWMKDAKRCLLHYEYGRFELVLEERGRMTRLSICATEEAARRKAAEWAAALDVAYRLPVVASWN